MFACTNKTLLGLLPPPPNAQLRRRYMFHAATVDRKPFEERLALAMAQAGGSGSAMTMAASGAWNGGGGVGGGGVPASDAPQRASLTEEKTIAFGRNGVPLHHTIRCRLGFLSLLGLKEVKS